MEPEQLKDLLEQVQNDELSVSRAMDELKSLPFADLGHSRIDHHRSVRCGLPEVLFCEGKSAAEIQDIAENMLQSNDNMLATRATESEFEIVKELTEDATYHERAGCITVQRSDTELPGTIGVISAGTSDAHAAEEARITCESFGASVHTVYDAGVAGLHRLLPDREPIRESDLLIVVAGMEGALPSVVAGLVDKPIIGVPTSTGYGTAFDGVTPLLGMLNSCTPAVVSVNIDNGFGAAYFACLILRTMNSTDDTQ